MIWLVAAAGAVGSVLRFVVDGWVAERVRTRIPLGTVLVNVTGSFLLGVVVGLGAGRIPEPLGTVLGVGLLGGYTTFSTASVEAVTVAAQGRGGALRAAAHAGGMLAASLGAAWLGLSLG
ncbi:MAG: fluoride efflux transporter FluC [Cellulomonadaceae bacterium]